MITKKNFFLEVVTMAKNGISSKCEVRANYKGTVEISRWLEQNDYIAVKFKVAVNYSTKGTTDYPHCYISEYDTYQEMYDIVSDIRNMQNCYLDFFYRNKGIYDFDEFIGKVHRKEVQFLYSGVGDEDRDTISFYVDPESHWYAYDGGAMFLKTSLAEEKQLIEQRSR